MFFSTTTLFSALIKLYFPTKVKALEDETYMRIGRVIIFVCALLDNEFTIPSPLPLELFITSSLAHQTCWRGQLEQVKKKWSASWKTIFFIVFYYNKKAL